MLKTKVINLSSIKAEIDENGHVGNILISPKDKKEFVTVLNEFYIENTNLSLVLSTKVPVLTKKETEYLSMIIKPFKNRVFRIIKMKLYSDLSFIRITYSNFENDRYKFLDMPEFKNEDMFRGLDLETEYTLKDLGLD